MHLAGGLAGPGDDVLEQLGRVRLGQHLVEEEVREARPVVEPVVPVVLVPAARRRQLVVEVRGGRQPDRHRRGAVLGPRRDRDHAVHPVRVQGGGSSACQALSRCRPARPARRRGGPSPRWCRRRSRRSSYAAGSVRPVGAAVAARVDGDDPEVPRQVRHLGLPHPAVHDRCRPGTKTTVVVVRPRRRRTRSRCAPRRASTYPCSSGSRARMPAPFSPVRSAQPPLQCRCNRPASAAAQALLLPASTRDARHDIRRETQMSTDRPDQPPTRPKRPPIDMDVLMEFVGRFVGDLGATIAAGNVLLGERLGLYRALAAGPGDAARWRPPPAPTRATSRSGCAARRPAATSSTTPPRRRTR